MESKSFYHKPSFLRNEKGYLTPLERKAAREMNNIALENRLFNDTETPIRREKENRIPNIHKRKAYRKLEIVTVAKNGTKKLLSSTPKKVQSVKTKVGRFSWAPKSLNRRFLKDKWIGKVTNLPVLHAKDLFSEQHNESVPDVLSQFKRIESGSEEAKSASFSIDCEDDGPPTKVRKMEAVKQGSEISESPEDERPADTYDDILCTPRNSGEVEGNSPEGGTGIVIPPEKNCTTDAGNIILDTAKNTGTDFQSESPENEGQKPSSKFFPIFNKVNKPKSHPKTDTKSDIISPTAPENLECGTTKIVKSRNKTPPKKQLIIDAGQKRFGATQCSMCGMVYSANHLADEQDHNAHHKRFLTFVKFTGWKNERVVASFMDGRIIKVTSGDPKYAMKKVADMLSIVDIDLGFQTPTAGLSSTKMAYFFISDTEKIVGCLVAERISQAHRLIPSHDSTTSPSRNILCFTDDVSLPAVCGVSRIWTYAPMRRKGVATRMLDAVRDSFVLGVSLESDQIAFSDPTPDGRAFATKYFKTPNILVYNFLRQ